MRRTLNRRHTRRSPGELRYWLFLIAALALAGCSDSDDGDDDDDDNDPPDTQAPVITSSVSPDANGAGWHNEDVTVTFECTDADSGIATCTDPITVDTEGESQTVTGTAVDQAGNSASTSVTIKLDKTPPALSAFEPADGATVAQPGVNLTGTVSDALSGTTSVSCEDGATINDAILTDSASAEERLFGCTLPLSEGAHTISVNATDIAGNAGAELLGITHRPLPRVAITEPTDGAVASTNTITVTGTIDDATATVRVNGNLATTGGGQFEVDVPVAYGINTLTAVAQNAAGRSDAQVRLIAVYGIPRPPTVQLTNPLADFVLGGRAGVQQAVPVVGWVRDNRETPDGLPPQIDITIDEIDPDTGTTIQSTTIPAAVENRTFGLCTTEAVCWRFTAQSQLPADTPLDLRVRVAAETGDENSTAVQVGVVDTCYQNNGDNNSAEACAASLVQRPGCTQSRRCIENSNGCPTAFGDNRNNPVDGEFARGSTAFGVNENPGSASGAFTVFGQLRPVPLPCNRHDECYSQWCPTDGPTRAGVVAEKQACNLRFQEDLLAVCRNAYPEFRCPEGRIGAANCAAWSEEKNRCFTYARMYYDHVVEDADRYLVAGSHYNEYPYGGFLTPVAGCPAVP